jgi:aspartate aminotransferase
VAGLNRIPGVSCLEPQGAFYVFPRVRDLGIPAAEVAERLLVRGGVACLPGTAFGVHGEGYLRFSYANSVERIREALAAIEVVGGEVAHA